MSDERFFRLEDKIDKVDEKVTKVEKSMITMENKLDSHIEIVQNHIAGDEKIISELSPLIPKLMEMTEDHSFKKMKKKERMGKLKYAGEKVTLALKILALPVALMSFLQLFS